MLRSEESRNPVGSSLRVTTPGICKAKWHLRLKLPFEKLIDLYLHSQIVKWMRLDPER